MTSPNGQRKNGPSVKKERAGKVASGVFALLISLSVSANVIFDGTLGPGGPAAGAPGYLVPHTSGMVAGNNLFHSFSTFDLAAGELATYSGPASIANIVSRVTGGSASQIDGQIRSSIAGADFWFINPAGIVFGQSARLSVTGAFHASTADYLRLADGSKFHASDPQSSSLSAAAPSAFGFLDQSGAAGSIDVHDSFLRVPNGESLTLSAGNLAIDRSTLVAFNGLIGITAMPAGELSVDPGAPLNVVPKDFNQVRIGNLSVVNTGSSNASANSGNIRIRGGQFEIGDSFIQSTNSGPGNGGTVMVEMTGTARLSNSELSANGSRPLVGARAGDAGDVALRSGDLSILNGTRIRANAFNQAQAGNITLLAPGHTIRFANTVPSGLNRVESIAFGTGAAGSIALTASHLVMDDGLVTTQTTGSGAGGMLTADLDTLNLRQGAQLTATTFGGGAGGRIDLTADEILIEGADANGARSGVFASTEGGSGMAGDLQIATDTLTVRDNGIISAGNFRPLSGAPAGSGDGGNLTVDAKTIWLAGGGEITVRTEGTGHAGTLNIHADTIHVSDRGSINSESRAGGDAGSINLQAGTLEIADRGIISAATFAAGDGGDVRISAASMLLQGDAEISAISQGTGRAGDIHIDAGEVFDSLNSAVRTSSVLADGGNISLIARDRVFLRDSTITTSVQGGAGSGGNIFIDPQFVILLNSQIIANAFGGPGGNITIVADNFLASPDSLVQASSQLGIDGTVEIKSPDADVSGSLAVLPATFFDAAGLLRQACGAAAVGTRSSLVASRHAVLIDTPDAYLTAPDVRFGAEGIATPSLTSSDKPAPALLTCAY